MTDDTLAAAPTAKAATQQEAQEPVATLHCNDIGYVWARATEVGKRMRFEQPINLYTAPQPAPAPAPQADSQLAPQGETNVQLDTDSNSPKPGQQRDVAGPVAVGQPVGHGSDSTAGDPSAQRNKLLTVAERNIRSFLRGAVFKSESDREAALNCVDVLWEAARAPADSGAAPAEQQAEESSVKLLAECRDAFPIPEPSSPLEVQWSAAMARPEEVPEYVRLCVAAMQAAPQSAPHLPERDASLPAERQGLFRKFVVGRVDGSDKPGGKHHGCTYFVLDVDHDLCARPALAAYAAACEPTHPTLAADLRTKWGVVPAPQPAPAPLSEQDPLQGAANWLAQAHGQFCVSVLQGCLMIGHNRAKRLHDAALAAQGGSN